MVLIIILVSKWKVAAADDDDDDDYGGKRMGRWKLEVMADHVSYVVLR